MGVHAPKLDQGRMPDIDRDGGWRMASTQLLSRPSSLPLCTSMRVESWQVNAEHGLLHNVPHAGCWVELPNGQSHIIPYQHHMADLGLVHVLDTLLRRPGAQQYRSINDVGCGLAQLGHTLLAQDARHRYWGCDAGDAMRVSGGFVHSCKETMANKGSLPTADWVVSLEVGEHVPRAEEAEFLRMLHGANCRGIILSWAPLGQPGHGHINKQPTSEFVPKVEALGYTVNHRLTQDLRGNASLAWFSTRRNCSAPRVPRLKHTRCMWQMGDTLTAFDNLRATALGCT